MKEERPILIIDNLSRIAAKPGVTDFAHRHQSLLQQGIFPPEIIPNLDLVVEYISANYEFQEISPTSGWPVYRYVGPD